MEGQDVGVDLSVSAQTSRLPVGVMKRLTTPDQLPVVAAADQGGAARVAAAEAVVVAVGAPVAGPASRLQIVRSDNVVSISCSRSGRGCVAHPGASWSGQVRPQPSVQISSPGPALPVQVAGV